MEFMMQYRSMNVNHLLDDEVEYELSIRAVDFTSGESRDVKRRKLRNIMKSEREKGNFVSLPVADNLRESEFNMIDEKLARIKHTLENKKTKKSEFPELKTRLLHLYYRACRLKENFDTDGLEGIAYKILNEHFSFFTNNPEVNANNSRLLMEELRAAKDKNTEADDEEEDDDIEELGKRVSSTPKPKRNRVVRIRTDAELTDKIMTRVNKLFIERFDEMTLELAKKLDRFEGKIAGKEKTDKKPEKSRMKNKRTTKSRSEEESEEPEVPEISSPEEEEEEDVNEEEESDESESMRKTIKRRPKAVSDWKLKYDGKDDGRGLNKFVSEVEFMAEAENITKKTLFKEAIHLFTGDARTWYIEGKKNREFTKWSELVTELKLEYQPPDMDFHYEQQASQRRQRRSEKFQDYCKAVTEIFEQMAIPPSDQRRFDIIYRNLRSDYKNALLVKGVRTLKMLKAWGRKLDAANWHLYRGKDTEHNYQRTAHINEVSENQPQRGPKPNGNDWKNRPQVNKPEWRNPQQPYQGYKGPQKDSNFQRKPQQENWKTDKSGDKQKAKNAPEQAGNSKRTLEARVAAYRIPDKTVCFNCRGNYHHFSACLKEKDVFCTNCGFHDYTADRCPVCAKNAEKSM